MRLRTLCCSVTAMLACLIGPPALADHALTPLITTPQGYTVYMTIANPYMPPGVEGTDDLNYFPLVRGFVISSALDFTGAFATGAPAVLSSRAPPWRGVGLPWVAVWQELPNGRLSAPPIWAELGTAQGMQERPAAQPDCALRWV